MLGRRTATLTFAGFLVVLGVSCGGVELESDQSAGASGEEATGGKGGTGGTGGTGAVPATGGKGGVQSTGGGPSSIGGTLGMATGGRGARGGGAGRLVQPTAGGTSGAGAGGASTEHGGQAGVAGEGGAGGQDASGSGGSTGGTGGSGFTYPTATPECEGDAPYAKSLSSFRCEDSESYGQGPTFEKVEGAVTLEACLAACSARSDCTAVSDFLHLTPSPTCYLERASCEVPQKPIASEENGAVVYEKVCEDGDCTFERIPGSYGCGSDLGGDEEVTTAESLDDCKAACLAEPECTAVNDFFWERDFPACFLNLGTCNAPVQNFQDGWLYVKCPPAEAP